MKTPQQKYPKKRSAGFSLIEFLVASVLSMIVLIAIGSGYFAARKINDVALGRLGVQQDMRNAANLIVRDARMAGSFGCFNMANKEPATVGSDGSASSNTPRNLIAAGQTTGLVPVKSFAGSTFNVTGFTASGNALVFQYGIGSASITGNNNGTMTMQMPADDPLQNISSNMPLVFSSCNVLDRPTSFAVTRGKDSMTINNINPALNTGHVAAEMSILRYMVSAYVIGTTTAGEQGLYRIQLGDDNTWQSPQLLLPGITAMNISYGYVGNCAPSGAAASDISRETFTFANALDGTQNPPTPALIRITLNGNTLAAQGKDMENAASRTDAGNVYVYNIEATLRGGNTCADRSI